MNGRRLLLLGAGFVIWSSAFVALYAMLSVGCRLEWNTVHIVGGLSIQRAQLVAIFLIHVAAGALLAFALRAPADAPFLARTAWLGALAGLGSSVVSFAAVFALSPCF